MHILFVCTGNICRSPMAEGMMNYYIKSRNLNGITCESAGTHAITGETPSKFAVKACAEYSVDISSHKSAQLTAAHLSRADVVFVMTLQQKIEIVKSGVPTGRIYVPSYGIPDPYGGNFKKYKETLKMIIEVLKIFIESEIK